MRGDDRTILPQRKYRPLVNFAHFAKLMGRSENQENGK